MYLFEKGVEMSSDGIQKITVENYKSISHSEIEIRPLTILAGANSSGKSSMIQPLLLLKQTLETPQQQTGILFSGKNVPLTNWEQIKSKVVSQSISNIVKIGIESLYLKLTSTFKPDDSFLNLKSSVFEFTRDGHFSFELTDKMPNDELSKIMENCVSNLKLDSSILNDKYFELVQDHCFFNIYPRRDSVASIFSRSAYRLASPIDTYIMKIIHVPGLRIDAHNREHSKWHIPYSRDGDKVDYWFRGTFPTYLASLIEIWEQERNGRYEQFTDYVRQTGLTNKVSTRKINDSTLEIIVGWDPKNDNPRKEDMINIADVGIGTSQVLPILAAIVAAQPGQIVYIEQPAVHLHPKPLIALAQIFADAAARGVKIIIETHSATLLLALQLAVSTPRDGLKAEDVVLYWFTKDDDGVSKITKGELDENGAYGEFPEDFSYTTLKLQHEYMSVLQEKILQ